QFREALDDFGQVLQLDADNGLAHYFSGLAHAKLGHVADALDALTAAIRLDPTAGRAYAHRALIHQAAGRGEEALADLADAVRLEEQFAAEYLFLRGQMHAEREEYAEAAADYTIALRLGPKNADAIAEARTAAMEALRDQPRRKPPTTPPPPQPT